MRWNPAPIVAFPRRRGKESERLAPSRGKESERLAPSSLPGWARNFIVTVCDHSPSSVYGGGSGWGQGNTSVSIAQWPRTYC
jgi:hypothetical protein